MKNIRSLLTQDIYSMSSEDIQAHIETLQAILDERERKRLSDLSWKEVDDVRMRLRDCETIQALVEEGVWA